MIFEIERLFLQINTEIFAQKILKNPNTKNVLPVPKNP